MNPSITATRRIRKLREIAEESARVSGMRAYLKNGQSCPVVGRDIPVNLAGPWKGRDVDKILTAWGVPLSLGELDGLAHLREGGAGTFRLPERPGLYAFLAKAARHVEAVSYLDLVARLSIWSQMTLSEALVVVVDCMGLDPHADMEPRLRASDWAKVAMSAVDAWQARTTRCDGRHVGDPQRCAELMTWIRRVLDEWDIRQAEIDLERKRSRLVDAS